MNEELLTTKNQTIPPRSNTLSDSSTLHAYAEDIVRYKASTLNIRKVRYGTAHGPASWWVSRMVGLVMRGKDFSYDVHSVNLKSRKPRKVGSVPASRNS